MEIQKTDNNPELQKSDNREQDLAIEEFSITELEDRLEFVTRCDNRCN